MRRKHYVFTWDSEPADERPSEFVDARRMAAAALGRRTIDAPSRQSQSAIWRLLTAAALVVAMSSFALVELAHFLHR